MNILLYIILPLISGLLIAIFKKNEKIKVLSILTNIVLLILSIYNLIDVINNGDISIRLTDSGLLGIELISNPISSILIVLSNVIFLIIGLYILMIDQKNTFHFLLLTIEGVILLTFLSNDLFNIFVLLEVATIICGILIMYLRDKRSVYDGLIFILVNSVGIMFYLMGVAMMYKIFGNLDISNISSKIKEVNYMSSQTVSLNYKELFLPFAFLMTGLSIKSAFFPGFGWLPKAHGTPGAPTVVSVILSAIQIKTTIYVFVKLLNMFSPVFNMDKLLLVLGIIGAFIGIFYALCTNDIKEFLAYSTISQVGLILIGFSANEDMGIANGILHILSHGMFKTLLFLMTGFMVNMYETRKINEINGLYKKNKLAGISLVIGLLAITGFPFTNGFVSKYYIMKAYDSNIVVKIILEIINFGTILYSIRFFKMLFGDTDGEYKIVWNKKLALFIPSIIIILMGTYGSKVYSYLIGLKYSIGSYDILKKLIVWIIMFVIAILCHKHILNKSKLFNKELELNLGFNSLIFSILISFFIYIVYALLFAV